MGPAQIERVRTPRFRGWAEESQARQFRAVWNYHAGSGRIVLLWWLLYGVRWAEVRGQFAIRQVLFPRAQAERVRIPWLSDWAMPSRARRFRAVWNYHAGSGRVV